MHPIRRGVMPTDRVHRLPQQAQPRAIRPHRPQPPTSDAATQLRHARPAPNERRCTRYVALHPLRRNAPDQKGCNAYRSGAPPPTTSTTAGTPSQHTTTGSIRRSHTASKYPRRFRARPAAPVTSRYTRYVTMHPIRRGAMPTDRVHRLPQQAQPRAIRPHRPQPSTSDAATQLRHARPAPNERCYTRYVALHPLRRNAPVTSRCTRSEGVQCLRIGCTAT